MTTPSGASCSSCRTPLPGGALFCPTCGAATPTEMQKGTGTVPESSTVEVNEREQRDRVQRALGEGFRLGRLLGRGGFAEVYAATDLHLKRQVAVKVLRGDLLVSTSLSERFRREAEAVASLRHPNVVSIYQVGEAEGLAYYIMPLIEGQSLRERLDAGPLPAGEARRILMEVASALAVAHKAGIIHRDVKPDNIMLEGDERRVVVMDFGIAKAVTSHEAGLTGTGMIVGTPHYMAPEQAMGSKEIDARADLYSLGIVAYQMLAGRLPFEGASAQEVLIQHITGDPPPLESLCTGVPEDLLDVVEGCLAKDPGGRWPSADALIARLHVTPAEQQPSVTVSAVRRRTGARQARRRRWLLASAGGAGVLAVAAVAWMVFGRAAGNGAGIPEGMVAIPGGSYPIGSDDEPRARPAHRLALAGFAIDRTEVTVAAYRRFADATNAEIPWSGTPDSLLPVTGVRWSEAAAFCASRGARLPTEFEWEAAARGPEGRRYAWGDVLDTAAAEIGHPAARGPAPVATHPRGNTPLGVADLIGNVWEWTSSRMAAYPGGASVPGGDTLYVIRGGAFNVPAAYTTAYYRGGIAATPASRRDIAFTGFRCAASLPSAASSQQ